MIITKSEEHLYGPLQALFFKLLLNECIKREIPFPWCSYNLKLTYILDFWCSLILSLKAVSQRSTCVPKFPEADLPFVQFSTVNIQKNVTSVQTPSKKYLVVISTCVCTHNILHDKSKKKKHSVYALIILLKEKRT